MTKFLYILFLLLLTIVSKAQKETFLELSNKLFCNVYDYKNADSVTYNFLKDSFPDLTKPVDGIVVHAPISTEAIISKSTLKFKKHPCFDFTISGGQLDFKTVQEPGYSRIVEGLTLFLVFQNEEKALLAYTQLVDRFMQASTTKSTGSEQGKTISRFTGQGKYFEQRIQLTLLTNPIQKKYAIVGTNTFW